MTKDNTKNNTQTNLPIIASIIHNIRGQKVIVDSDLATLYGTTTKRLNEAVKRNIERFPEEFMFQLSNVERNELVAICDQFKNLKHSYSNPYVFTEHGALMVANVLRNPKAINASIEIVRAFVTMRKMLFSVDELRTHLEKLESKYDKQLKIIFETLQIMLNEPEKEKGDVGFRTD